MKLSMLLPPKKDEKKWTLAKQVGVNNVITKAASELSCRPAPYNIDALKSIKDDFNKEGFTLCGLEGDQFDMSPIKLGLPNRDECIEHYQQMIRNMGQLGIRLLCYNFMASIGWFRTSINIPERGGALTSEFDFEKVKCKLVPEELRISEKKLWANLFYFLDAVLPVAEENGVRLALHPDDPPVSPLQGVARIITSAAAYDTIYKKYPSPANAITFCQATFKTMGEDIKSVSKRWLAQNRIAFIHLRDVEGNKYKFRETFHDNGPTPMAEMLKYYYDNGFDGIIRPDHTPAMYEESQVNFSGGISAGYGMTGNVFAVGYIKGICEAYKIILN